MKLVDRDVGLALDQLVVHAVERHQAVPVLDEKGLVVVGVREVLTERVVGQQRATRGDVRGVVGLLCGAGGDGGEAGGLAYPPFSRTSVSNSACVTRSARSRNRGGS